MATRSLSLTNFSNSTSSLDQSLTKLLSGDKVSSTQDDAGNITQLAPVQEVAEEPVAAAPVMPDNMGVIEYGIVYSSLTHATVQEPVAAAPVTPDNMGVIEYGIVYSSLTHATAQEPVEAPEVPIIGVSAASPDMIM